MNTNSLNNKPRSRACEGRDQWWKMTKIVAPAGNVDDAGVNRWSEWSSGYLHFWTVLCDLCRTSSSCIHAECAATDGVHYWYPYCEKHKTHNTCVSLKIYSSRKQRWWEQTVGGFCCKYLTSTNLDSLDEFWKELLMTYTHIYRHARTHTHTHARTHAHTTSTVINQPDVVIWLVLYLKLLGKMLKKGRYVFDYVPS